MQIEVRGTMSRSFPYRARALGFWGEYFLCTRAQNLKLVVVLVLQSEGRF